MRPALRAIVVLTSFALVSCSSGRGPVSHFVEPSQDLSRYATWDFDEPEGPAEGDLDRQIRLAIARELASRGYRRTETRLPELVVSYRLDLRHEVLVYNDTQPAQFVPSFHDVGNFEVGRTEQRTRVYETGTLSVRVGLLLEGDSAWWGMQSTRARVDYGREVERSVTAIFDTFPTASSASVRTRTAKRDGAEEGVAAP